MQRKPRYSLFLSQAVGILLSSTAAQIRLRRGARAAEERCLWLREMQRENTHHFWGAVCTFVWSSVCHTIHSSTDLYSCSHNLKISSNRRTSLALSHLLFEMATYRALFTMQRKIWGFTTVSSGKYVLSFPVWTWSSSPQRFSVWLGLKDSAVGWISAPRVSPSRMGNRSFLPKKGSVRCGSCWPLCAWWKEGWWVQDLYRDIEVAGHELPFSTNLCKPCDIGTFIHLLGSTHSHTH